MTPDVGRAASTVGGALIALRSGFNREAAAAVDPVGIVRAWPAEEREVVAHLTAFLAYGRVAAIRAAVARVLVGVGNKPTQWARERAPGAFYEANPTFVYRMTRAQDVDDVLVGLGNLLRRHGTLHAAFLSHDPGTGDLHAALSAYARALRAAMPATAGRGARYLVADPAKGSASKRWWLLLRWMIRPDDGADLGCWQGIDPARLILPLDTHVGRLVNALGLVERVSDDLIKAREATAQLLQWDPHDPLSFDMPLCHLGIARDCLYRHHAATCSRCALCGVCRWTRDAGPVTPDSSALLCVSRTSAP